MGIPTITGYALPTERDLPPDRLPWTCDRRRAALLIHDMQHYFVGRFPPGPPVTGLVANIARLAAAAREHRIPVIYTAQPGGMTPEQRGLLADVWGPGMGTAAEEREIVPELSPTPSDTVLTKWRYSAFARSPLQDVLAAYDRDQLIITGVYAHVGCLSTACDAFSRDIRVFLVADAVADFDADYHRLALRYAAERCARPVCTDRLIAELAGVGAPTR
jgi:bifunctional isochorismate lyase/aryl carrier protein